MLDHSVLLRRRDGRPLLGIGALPRRLSDVERAGYENLVLMVPPHGLLDDAHVSVDVFAIVDQCPPTTKETERARRASARVAGLLHVGRPTLVCCFEGRNRSALVASLALTRAGYNPEETIKFVRRTRGQRFGGDWERVLSNDCFREIIRRAR